MRTQTTNSSPISVTLAHYADYNEWRTRCKGLLSQQIPPEQVAFSTPRSNGDLFASVMQTRVHPDSAPEPHTRIRVPKAFPNLARQVLCHSDDARFSLLYRLLWRLQSDRTLLLDESDPDVWTAMKLAQSVRRDSHKMKAFVRFRKIRDAAPGGLETFVAWFEPDHHVVEFTAPFFARRFAGMGWSIVTPLVSAHWDGATLTFGEGAQRSDCPDDDALEDHWRVYYSSIFNPARLKVKAMMAEMPAKYWRNLPESRLIPELTRSAKEAQRAAPSGTAPSMSKARQLVAAQPGMQPNVVVNPNSADEIRTALKHCSRCSLCQHATNAVAGEGPQTSKMMIVGEQPGDAEDLAGRPFIGPAGDVLNRALEEAGITRSQIYVTNAVKHFKHTVRGKRRLHARPGTFEVEQCRWWLDLEIKLVAPRVIVALGQTALRALTGDRTPLNEVRGRPLPLDNNSVMLVTAHPAYVLRTNGAAAQHEQHRRLVKDLVLANAMVSNPPEP